MLPLLSEPSSVDWTLVWVFVWSLVLPVLVAVIVPPPPLPSSAWWSSLHADGSEPTRDVQFSSVLSDTATGWYTAIKYLSSKRDEERSGLSPAARLIDAAVLSARPFVRVGRGVFSILSSASAAVHVAVSDPLESTFATWALTACARGDDGVLRLLLDAGAVDADARADTAAVARYGFTLLRVAAACGRARAVALLLSRGADPDTPCARGWRPLHGAADSDSAEVVALLLRANADMEGRTRAGRTPLDVGVAAGSSRVVAVLAAEGGAAGAAAVSLFEIALARARGRGVSANGVPAVVAEALLRPKGVATGGARK